MTCFKILSKHLFGETKESHKNLIQDSNWLLPKYSKTSLIRSGRAEKSSFVLRNFVLSNSFTLELPIECFGEVLM
jgi:hypothetical protein